MLAVALDRLVSTVVIFLVGGASMNTGTVPSKTLRETALYFSGLNQRGLYGIDYSLKEGLTVSDFMHRKQIVVESEWAIIQNNLERHHIELIYGKAALCDEHTVRVHLNDGGERELRAANQARTHFAMLDDAAVFTDLAPRKKGNPGT